MSFWHLSFRSANRAMSFRQVMIPRCQPRSSDSSPRILTSRCGIGIARCRFRAVSRIGASRMNTGFHPKYPDSTVIQGSNPELNQGSLVPDSMHYGPKGPNIGVIWGILYQNTVCELTPESDAMRNGIAQSHFAEWNRAMSDCAMRCRIR